MSRMFDLALPELESLDVIGPMFVVMTISQIVNLEEDKRLDSLKLAITNWSEQERTFVPSQFVELLKQEFPKFKLPVKLGL